jgi:hypothetical protein
MRVNSLGFCNQMVALQDRSVEQCTPRQALLALMFILRQESD